ncbi:hypothetical protein WR25_10006 [Diploscapter pachys]|uniref:Galactokinase N-terminal domain-containing protein n=1 Tax=Diploscapter pachys TaxID=2018661 RepID=A0A2A2L6P1_9BILA|nr:hypothetical protein WR25_10006 [Diploscapter pachys]
MDLEDFKVKFHELYEKPAQVCVRCPGRVNLIGEHIDYHGYDVLPMAIEACCIILSAPSESNQIRISNLDDKNYPSTTISLPSGWKGATPPKWFDYLLSGWRGILDLLKSEDQDQKGMDLLVTGSVPESSGLSSSSSLVCAAALTAYFHQTGKSFGELTKFYPTPVRRSKSRSTLCLLFLLAFQIQKITENAVFVVMHCGERMNKAATSCFNQRVTEGKICGQILLKHANVKSDAVRLKDVSAALGKNPEECKQLVDTVVPEEISKEDLLKIIDEQALDKCLSHNTKDMPSFTLKRRGLHVYGEASRVDQFHRACEAGDLNLMGKLLDEGHQSLSKLYEASTEVMDEMVEFCKDQGALGARLTGAGWGGCAVILFEKGKIPKSILEDKRFLFISSPASGISLQKI